MSQMMGTAISADFGHRSAHETRVLELFPSLEAIRHTRSHFGAWMKPQKKSPSIWFRPGRARIIPQPLGVVGIIVPWNYPLFLAISPLAAALVPEAYRYGGRSLDDWLAAFGIECTIRHNAAADALATAELLLRLRSLAGRQGTRGHAGLMKVARQQKWLAGCD
jgi:hypothetical protein